MVVVVVVVVVMEGVNAPTVVYSWLQPWCWNYFPSIFRPPPLEVYGPDSLIAGILESGVRTVTHRSVAHRTPADWQLLTGQLLTRTVQSQNFHIVFIFICTTYFPRLNKPLWMKPSGKWSKRNHRVLVLLLMLSICHFMSEGYFASYDKAFLRNQLWK